MNNTKRPATHALRAIIGAGVLTIAACSALTPDSNTPPARVAASPPDGLIILATPAPILQRCEKIRSNPPADLPGDFWIWFDDLFWSKAPQAVVKERDGAWNALVSPWGAVAATEPGTAARDKAKSTWLRLAAQEEVTANLALLSSYQLELMRCYFPGPGPARLDPAAVHEAFRIFGLGKRAPDTTSDTRRMKALGGWLVWSAFADSLVQDPDHRIPPGDRAAWEILRRSILYGFLLHAHHDERSCPGNCSRDPRILPRGLKKSPTPEEIRLFVDAERDVPEAIYESYRMMGAPNLLYRPPK